MSKELSANGAVFFAKLVGFWLTGVIAGAAGVGGGALYIPYIVLVFGYFLQAVALSKAAVFGAAVCFFVTARFDSYRSRRSGEEASARQRLYGSVAYDVVLILEPMTLAFAPLGARGALASPYLLMLLLMVALLLLSAVETFRKAAKKRAQENRSDQYLHLTEDVELRCSRVRIQDATMDPTSISDLNHLTETDLVSMGTASVTDDEADSLSETSLALPPPESSSDATNEDSNQKHMTTLSRRCYGVVILVWVMMLLCSILGDGQGGQPSLAGVPCGSALSWIIAFCPIVSVIGLTLLNIRYLRSFGGDSPTGEQLAIQERWGSVRKSIGYAVASGAAGFASSYTGIGGSTIKGPLLLRFGVSPEIVKRTSQWMLLSTSSLSMSVFAVNGLLPPVLGVIFFVTGSLAACTGEAAIRCIMRKYRRTSTFAFILGGYVLLALITMFSLGIIKTIEDFHNQESYDITFHSICTSPFEDTDDWTWIFN